MYVPFFGGCLPDDGESGCWIGCDALLPLLCELLLSVDLLPGLAGDGLFVPRLLGRRMNCLPGGFGGILFLRSSLTAGPFFLDDLLLLPRIRSGLIHSSYLVLNKLSGQSFESQANQTIINILNLKKNSTNHYFYSKM